MATAFTHAFVGAGLATVGDGAAGRRRLALALAALAVMPDLDVVGYALGIPYGHPLGHRGVTHSLPFAAATGVAVAALFFRPPGAPARAWLGVAALLAAATASHGVLDAFTDGGKGVGFFIPFHDERYFFPWRPLETSPLEPARFFRGRALDILANEVRWVWVPFGVALLGLHAVRWVARRRA